MLNPWDLIISPAINFPYQGLGAGFMAVQNDWAQGYVTDTLYTDNIYREISPAWINYVAVQHGCQPLPLKAGSSEMIMPVTPVRRLRAETSIPTLVPVA